MTPSTGPAETDTSGIATTGDPDTDTDTDTDGSSSLDPACEAADPDIDATFEVALEGWEIDDGYGFYNIDDDCMISSVEVADGMWTTELDCGEAETPRTATLSVAEVAGASPGWAAGDEVRLEASTNANSFGGFDWFLLTRGDAMLAQGIDGDDVDSGLEALASRIDAIGSYDECAAPLPGDGGIDVGKLGLHFERGEQSLTLISGHRGAFELADGGALWIDVEQAESGHCCHGFHRLRVLKRATAPGE